MVYMLLGTGFEETEAIAPLDLLRRAGVEVLTGVWIIETIHWCCFNGYFSNMTANFTSENGITTFRTSCVDYV